MFRLVLWAALLCGLVLPETTGAATVDSIQFRQLIFEEVVPGSPPIESDIGRVDVHYLAEPDAGFLNVRARFAGATGEGAWIVRNVFLHSMDFAPPDESVSIRFPLEEIGYETGLPPGPIEFAVSVDLAPVLDIDYADWVLGHPFASVASIDPAPVILTQNVVGVGAIDFSYDPTWRSPFVGPAIWSVPAHPGCTMPNIDLDAGPGSELDENGCLPAACANSLHWLKNTNPFLNFPGTLRDTFREMSRLMNRTEPKGVEPEDAARAKLDFAEAHGLPIHVKYQDGFHSGNVSSTTGLSSATDMGAAGKYPTKAWIESEMNAGEDVEVNISYAYVDSGKVKWAHSHALVATGIGERAGVPWIKFKHDNDQRNTDSEQTKQEHSDIKVNGQGQIYLPDLKTKVKRGDGTLTEATPFVTSVISESFDPLVPPLPPTGANDDYCQVQLRTIPPGGSLDVAYPNPGDYRCYNSTLYRIDRTVTPPRVVLERQWNFNKGQTRTWVNQHDYPVTVALHNDDWQSGDPYPAYTVGLTVNPDPGGLLTTPGNPDLYGGFSLGGDDDSAWEFLPEDATSPHPTFLDVGPVGEGLGLDAFPSVLGEFQGTRDLRIWTEIPHWNDYWGQLGLLVDVVSVQSTGDLWIDCPSTGFQTAVPIVAPGRYEFDLGALAPSTQFELMLSAQGGLLVHLDCLGVPSRVQYHGTATPPPSAGRGLFVDAAVPNPLNPSTEIRFGVDSDAPIDLAVFDLRGRRVRWLESGWKPAGEYVAHWDGRNDQGRPVASGSYVVRLSGPGGVASTKVTVVR